MKYVIVDDDEITRVTLRNILLQIDTKIELEIFTDGMSCLKYLQNNPCDIAFVDIEMPEMDGMTLARKLERSPQIIFVTGHKNYAVDAFYLNIADFVTKPFNDVRIKLAIDKAKEKINSNLQITKQLVEALDDVFYLYNIQKASYEYITSNTLEVLGVENSYFFNGGSYTNDYVVKDYHETLKACQVHVERGENYEIEYEIEVEGNRKWIHEKSYPIFDEDGKVVKNSGICRDISEQVRIKHNIEESNRNYRDSINYASTIQRASLTDENYQLSIFPESFVLFEPKEAIGGDFYILENIRTNDGGVLKCAILADCTGHGVPGAMLTLLCQTLLRESFVNKSVNSPGESLNFVRDKINTYLSAENKVIRDGMDISYCVVNPKDLKLYFAGALNKAYVLRQKDWLVVDGDKFHVGNDDRRRDFTTKVIDLQKNDIIYLFSDGFPDQFGGSMGKKYKRKRLMDFILNIHTLPMSEQKEKLWAEFKSWQGECEQVDDVSLLAFKI